MTDEEAMDNLPELVERLTMLTSGSVNEFEKNIDRVLEKTMKKFEEMVDCGILSTDPEQMVNAIKVLTTAKRDINNGKRQLIETTMRGLALKKVVNGEKPLTALDKWNEKMKLEGHTVEETASNGIFGEIKVD